MDVVAIMKGKYGVVREVGDPFTIDGAKVDGKVVAFSERWMAPADSRAARDAVAEAGTTELGVSRADIRAEIAEAMGESAAKAMQDADEIADLKKQLAEMKADGSAKTAAAPTAKPAAAPVAEPDAAPAAEPDAAPAAKPAAAPSGRKTRRATRS